MDSLTIATRGSALALWQAHFTRDTLRKCYPDLSVKILTLTTTGDRILEKSLAKIGGKGLFVKEIEEALQDGRAQIAVHSMKDVPVIETEGFPIVCNPIRAQPWDALCANGQVALRDLPEGAVVGTSSLRRGGQIKSIRPDLQIRSVRGNVPTRLSKTEEGEFDAVVLAHAGLARLGLSDRISETLSLVDCVPAACQGVLGIQASEKNVDVIEMVRSCLSDKSSEKTTAAERACIKSLGGSCTTPIAAYASIANEELTLVARVVSPDGSQVAEAHVKGNDPVALGIEAAEELKKNGATPILAALDK